MKKINKKGFILLETLLVSTVVITVLIYLYVQFSNLKNSYDTSFKYDSISDIYNLKQVDAFINKNYGYSEFKTKVNKSGENYIELYHNTCEMEYFSDNNSYCNKLMTNINVKTVIMVNNRLADVITQFKTHNPYSNGLYKYLASIDKNLASKSYLLIAEFKDNTYAYLKLDDVNVVVTFNPNGGTIKEKTKNVTPGQKYGTLPTPTREGYTFKGWNGKNYYNYKDICSSPYCLTDGFTSDNDGWIMLDTTNKTRYYNYWTNNLNIKENEEYYLILEVKDATNVLDFLMVTSSDGGVAQMPANKITPEQLNQKNTQIFQLKAKENVNMYYGLRTFYNNTHTNEVAKLTFRISVLDVNDNITEDNFEYEPYYITKDTKVVQNDNHTLTAIWEKNS